VLIGRNADTVVNTGAGWLMLVVGMAMLALLRTDANVFNFSIATCVVWFVLGMLLITASLYGRTGSAEAARAEEAYRHGGA